MAPSRLIRTTILCCVSVFLVTHLFYFVGQTHNGEPTQTLNQDRQTSGIFCPNTSLLAQLKTIDWESIALAPKTLAIIQTFTEQLIRKLIPFLVKSPVVPVNKSCLPPPGTVPAQSKCTILNQPRRVGVLLQFGFDVDALEIHLHELDAVVDKFFLIESIGSHSDYLTRKPLLWDYVKYDERFAPFLSKIVYFVVDDANLSEHQGNGGIWMKEDMQEKLRWSKFLQWNEANNFFRSTDLLGFGDTDEIPNRDNIFYLKHCEVHEDPIDIGIWFPYQGIHTIFRTDHPVQGHPFTLGDPTYWSLGKAMEIFKNTSLYPSRMRGKSPGHLLGGIHMSTYHYPPLQFVKLLTATEVKLAYIGIVIEAGKLYTNERYTEAVTIMNINTTKIADRIISVESLRTSDQAEADAIIKLPWFYNCNRERYPSFEQKHDSRLD